MRREIIIEDENGRRSFELFDAETVVGRGEDAEMVIDHKSISRRHLTLIMDGDDLFAEDMGSANGTLLNGESLESRRILNSGDLIELGEIALHVDVIHAGHDVDEDFNPDATPRGAMSVDEARRRADQRKKKSPIPLLAGLMVLIVGIGIIVVKNSDEDEKPTPEGTKVGLVAEGDAQANKGATTPDSKKKRDTIVVDDDVRRRAERRTRALETLGLELDQYFVQDDLLGAEELFVSFAKKHGKVPPSLRRRLSEKQDLFAAAALNDYQSRRNSGRKDLALAGLKERMQQLPESSAAHARLAGVLDIGQAIAGVTPKTTKTEGGTPTAKEPGKPQKAKPDLDESTRAQVARARVAFDRAWRERNFGQAAQSHADILKIANGGALDVNLDRRGRRALRIASLQNDLAAAFTAAPEKLTGLATPSPAKAPIVGVTEQGLRVLSEGQESDLPWNKVTDETMLGLITKAQPEGRTALAAADFALMAGKSARAHRMLHAAERSGTEFNQETFEILADHLGIEAPEKGFVWLEDRYVTPQDLARAHAREIIERAVAKLDSDKDSERWGAFATLRNLGPRAASAFHRGLLASRKGLLSRMTSMGGYQKLDELDVIKVSLERQRRHALELIFDEVAYPYPYQAPAAAQKHNAANVEIKKRVAPIREIWKDDKKAKISADLRRAIARLSEIESEIVAIGIGFAEPAPRFLLWLPKSNEVTIRTLAWSADERLRIDESYAWMKVNDTRQTFARKNEVKQVAITNEYRLLMGRHAVKVNDRLVESARMHSNDMSRLGFFAHDNPHEPKKRTPWDRMRWVGFFGSGGSENIARTGGSPMSAHKGWITSSGHHRNILGRDWRLLGSGNDGPNWTQNFSIREMSDEDREAAGLPKGGFRTLEVKETGKR